MHIIGADRVVDGTGSLKTTDRLRKLISQKALRAIEYRVAPVHFPWGAPLPQGYLKSACSPMQAILNAKKDLESDSHEVAILSGEDFIRTRYGNNKEERNRLFKIYTGGLTPLDGYTELAKRFAKKMNLSIETFHQLSDELFKNYLRTWKQLHPNAKLPEKKWFELVTPYFRGVDCANPSVDFQGCIIIVNPETSDRLEINEKDRISILGCSLEQSGKDGIEHLDEILPYAHIAKAFDEASTQAQLDFRALFLGSEALLEVYTCYPVVALGFLLSTQMVNGTADIPSFLEKYPITVTGGLNLSKAPGNNTTLSNIVAMVDILKSKNSPKYGGIHANGSLGYQQGFLILGR